MYQHGHTHAGGWGLSCRALPVAVLRVADNFFEENPDISRLGEHPIAYGKYHIPWLLNESPDHYASDVAEGRRQMRKLKEWEDSLGDDDPGTVVVMHGKYSYPNGLGPDKVRGAFSLHVFLARKWVP